MAHVLPRIVERFPSHRERILRAQFRDAAVAELCRDYDTLVEALEDEVMAKRIVEPSHSHQVELRTLMEDLEKELFERMSRIDKCGQKSLNMQRKG